MWRRLVRDEDVVQEGGDVVEDRLGIEEQFREEGEVLGVQLGCKSATIYQRRTCLPSSGH